jgi:hypothetical protein
MNRERLEHLITVLERVEREKLPFNIEVIEEDPNDCRSAACAFGWARRDLLFITQCIGSYVLLDVPAFFGLSRDQGYHLFMPSSYGVVDFGDRTAVRPAHVIERIRELLAEDAGAQA